MKTATVWRALCACSLLSAVTALTPVLRAAVINTPTDWTDAVAAANLNNGGASFIPLKSTNTTPDTDQYAWAGYQWIESYVALAQKTGSSTYMDTAKEIIDHIFANRDDVRFATTPLDYQYWSAPTYYLYYNNVPAKGWRRIPSGATPHPEVTQLIDGRVCEAILMWCELARRGFPQYEPAIATYLPKIKETLDMHLPSMFDIPSTQPIPPDQIYTHTLAAKSFKYWRDESQGTPTSPNTWVWSALMPINQNCTFARAMLGYQHLTGDTSYDAKIRGVVNYFLNALDTARPGIAAWMYSPLDAAGSARGKMEDLGHAAIDLSLVEEAYRCGGYGVTDDHIVRLVESFDIFYDAATKRAHTFVDGSGSIEAAGSTAVYSLAWKSWLWLSQFDPTIATRVRATYNTYFTSKTNDSACFAGWANLIYWESYLAGTAAFDDSSIGAPPRPLYNDTVNRLLYPYCVQTTSTEVTGGAPEGTKQIQMGYTITSGTGSASTVYSLAPAENILGWGGIKITYKHTGPAVWSLILMDGTNAMTASLPTQASYATRTLRWSDFTNVSAVNKSAITKLRISTTGTPVGSTGQFFFDDVKWVP